MKERAPHARHSRASHGKGGRPGVWGWLFLLCGAYPLWRAWAATAGTPLRHAVAWGTAAWVSWIGCRWTASLVIKEELHPAIEGGTCGVDERWRVGFGG